RLPSGFDLESIGERIRGYAGEMFAAAGLPELLEVLDLSSAQADVAPPPSRRRKPASRTQPSAPRTAAPLPQEPKDGTYDYVGIVMAKSAEGDAVAEILSNRDGIEVIEQPAFWDIR